MRPPRLSLVVVAMLFAGASGRTEPDPSAPIARKIDDLISAGHPRYAVAVAAPADDAEFLRRATLDLAGTIPTAAEVRAYLADTSADKRIRLVDRLLASPDHVRRMVYWFDVMVMDRRNDNKVPRPVWEKFLEQSFAEKKPYDQLVKEILSNDGGDPKNRGPAKFFLDRDFEPNAVTRDLGRVFLGRNLTCAQCHDHPLVDDYKQDQYFGIMAFLNRSYLFPNVQSVTAVLAEKAEGEVSFTSVFDKAKVQKTTGPRVPGLKVIAEPKFDKGKEYKIAPAKDVRPVPAYSRREQLAAAVTAADNKAFARTTANRLWALMFGRGLIHPLDMDHGDNPPSHPALLDYLAEELRAAKYDTRTFLRHLALTKTYGLSSVPNPAATDIAADRFTSVALKPLSPEVFAHAVVQASGLLDSERTLQGAKATDAGLYAKVVPYRDSFRRMFGTRAGEPEEGFAAGLDQTLFLKHGGTLRSLITPRAGNLADRTVKLPTPEAMAEELYVSIFGRMPGAEEKKDVADLLRPADRRGAAINEIIWAMMASAEFRFNR